MTRRGVVCQDCRCELCDEFGKDVYFLLYCEELELGSMR